MNSKLKVLIKSSLLLSVFFNSGCNHSSKSKTYKFLSSSILITSDREDKEALLQTCKSSSIILFQNDIIINAGCVFGHTKGFSIVKQKCVDSSFIEEVYGNRVISQLNIKGDSCYNELNIRIKFDNKKEDSCALLFTSNNSIAILYDIYLLQFVKAY